MKGKPIFAAKQAVVAYWTEHAKQCAPPSPIGYQLEAARLGLSLEAEAATEIYYQEEHIDYEDAVLVLRDLDECERMLLGVLVLGIAGHEFDVERLVPHDSLIGIDVPFDDEGGDCLARTLSGGLCRRRRPAGIARCKQHENQSVRPALMVTKDGDTFVCLGTVPEMALVVGHRTRPPTLAELAETLGVPVYSLRRVVSGAWSKVEERLQAVRDACASADPTGKKHI